MSSNSSQSIVNINNVAIDLENKLDLDLVNLSTAGKIVGGGLAFPSNEYINLTVGTSGTYYTAPADGWYTVTGKINSSSDAGYVYLSNNDSLHIISRCHGTTGTVSCFISTRKDQRVQFQYMKVTNVSNSFNYAQGSEPTS